MENRGRISEGMRARCPTATSWCLGFVVLAILVSRPVPARADPTLTGSDFVLSLNGTGGNSGSSWTEIGSDALESTFTAHRCRCPAEVEAELQIATTGQAKIGTSTVAAELMLGYACSGTSTTTCVSLGTVTLNSSTTDAVLTFSTNIVYQAESGKGVVDCGNLTSGSTTLWAVISQDGTMLGSDPSLLLPVTTTVVDPPTGVTALTADGGLLVSWSLPSDTSAIAGYQVLCLPEPSTASSAAYETCGENPSATSSDGLMSTALLNQVCSAEVSASSTSVRLSGLVNGTSYTVAVVSIDASGGTSALSGSASAIPEPTFGFFQKYQTAGGRAEGGCCFVERSAASPFSLAVVIALGLWVCRRRREAPSIAILLVLLGGRAQAQIATEFEMDHHEQSDSETTHAQTPASWTIELGFGPYRPAVDSEFSDGQHPFADTFSSSARLMSEFEVDRHVSHRFGSWAVGGRIGYYHASAAAWAADGTSRSGDQTTFRLLPLSISMIYRADFASGENRFPLIPYAKLGLDYCSWSTGRTAAGTNTGWTPGWHAAGGVALDLGIWDRNSANLLAHDLGLDRMALFFEWNYVALDGLGAANRLHVGDDTWLAGLMLDM